MRVCLNWQIRGASHAVRARRREADTLGYSRSASVNPPRTPDRSPAVGFICFFALRFQPQTRMTGISWVDERQVDRKPHLCLISTLGVGGLRRFALFAYRALVWLLSPR